MLDGVGGESGAGGAGFAAAPAAEADPAPRRGRAVPSYVAAEAETAPLPRITVSPPPFPPKTATRTPLSRIGDLPMRVVYRIAAAGLAIVVAAAAAVVLLVLRAQPGEAPSRPIAAPSAAPPSPASPVAPPTLAASPPPVSAPERTAMEDALDDPRVPGEPERAKLGKLPGKPARVAGRIIDRRSRVHLPRLGGPWKRAAASPFRTRQVLPAAKGAGHRALIVSCPVPIEVQDDLRDTALLAARWTLNHQPRGATLSWVASQPAKYGRVLAYRVKYQVKGEKRSSMAAVALVEPRRRPSRPWCSSASPTRSAPGGATSTP
ncbi:hypothetical protein [Thermocatellispora tengchongensis]|uniref:hypothetical protein n=1 Tax=Thermocatellispora tengchongensis TaxID=1073253 RepID=UPI003635164C